MQIAVDQKNCLNISKYFGNVQKTMMTYRRRNIQLMHKWMVAGATSVHGKSWQTYRHRHAHDMWHDGHAAVAESNLQGLPVTSSQSLKKDRCFTCASSHPRNYLRNSSTEHGLHSCNTLQKVSCLNTFSFFSIFSHNHMLYRNHQFTSIYLVSVPLAMCIWQVITSPLHAWGMPRNSHKWLQLFWPYGHLHMGQPIPQPVALYFQDLNW